MKASRIGYMERMIFSGDTKHDKYETPEATDPDPSWRDHAACADEVPAEYHPFHFTSTSNSKAARNALRICNELCPVRERCLQFALDNDAHYIFGGTTYNQRKAMK